MKIKLLLFMLLGILVGSFILLFLPMWISASRVLIGFGVFLFLNFSGFKIFLREDSLSHVIFIAWMVVSFFVGDLSLTFLLCLLLIWDAGTLFFRVIRKRSALTRLCIFLKKLRVREKEILREHINLFLTEEVQQVFIPTKNPSGIAQLSFLILEAIENDGMRLKNQIPPKFIGTALPVLFEIKSFVRQLRAIQKEDAMIYGEGTIESREVYSRRMKLEKTKTEFLSAYSIPRFGILD